MPRRNRRGRRAKAQLRGRRLPRAMGYHFDAAEMEVRPDGRPACRWCRGPVPKGRRSWCGDPRCRWEWERRSRWAATRRAVVLRDGGICRRCGLDCEALRREFFRVLAEVCGLDLAVGLAEGWTPKVKVPDVIVADFARRTGQPPCVFRNGGPFIEVDHVIPLTDGGDAFEWTNLQLLCAACHRAKTKADDRARRARTNGGLNESHCPDADARVSRRRPGDRGGDLSALAG